MVWSHLPTGRITTAHFDPRWHRASLFCVHPFEDGNGRIGRAIAEKAISEGLGHPALVALSLTINRNRKNYYDMLEHSNKSNEITDWLVYFAQTVKWRG